MVTRTLRNLILRFIHTLTKQKSQDFVNLIYKRSAVYKISCKNCSSVYVGETVDVLILALSKHKHDLRPINMSKLKDELKNYVS